VMSADSDVTYSFIHYEARAWSIPSGDPYEEDAQQLFEQAPHSPEALGAEMNAIASSLYHSLHPSGTPPLLNIPLSTPSTSRRAGILEDDTPPRNRLLLATPRPGCEVDVYTRESLEFCTQHHDAQKDRAVVRAEIEVLRSERLAYEQEGIQTREALARSEAYCKALEARVALLETQARRHEWQRQTVDDFAVQHIMRTQGLEAGARIDTWRTLVAVRRFGYDCSYYAVC
nr:hypothetical protein [Tanacetum cinerariifolium]